MVIAEVILSTHPLPQGSPHIAASTSDRNYQNQSQKWRYSIQGDQAIVSLSSEEGDLNGITIDACP